MAEPEGGSPEAAALAILRRLAHRLARVDLVIRLGALEQGTLPLADVPRLSGPLAGLLAAGLLGAGFAISPRETNHVVAAEGGASAAGCRIVEVALDEGYSVSRTETREVCDRR